jgi:DNA-binding transcriptional ArsR family regulator
VTNRRAVTIAGRVVRPRPQPKPSLGPSSGEPRRDLSALVGVARAGVLLALRRPQTTTSLSALLRIAPSTASEHLTALARTGLVDRRRRGREVYYLLNERGRTLLALFDPP